MRTLVSISIVAIIIFVIINNNNNYYYYYNNTSIKNWLVANLVHHTISDTKNE